MVELKKKLNPRREYKHVRHQILAFKSMGYIIWGINRFIDHLGNNFWVSDLKKNIIELVTLFELMKFCQMIKCNLKIILHIRSSLNSCFFNTEWPTNEGTVGLKGKGNRLKIVMTGAAYLGWNIWTEDQAPGCITLSLPN